MKTKQIKSCTSNCANLSYVSNGVAAFGETVRTTIFLAVLRRYSSEKRIGVVRQLADWVFVSFLPSKKKIESKSDLIREFN